MTESSSVVWYGRRPDLTSVRFSGADVLSFLQSKLAADTRRWRRDGGGYAVATDINGKVLFDGEFSLLGDEVIAALPTALVDAAVQHLEAYVIMEDVVISRMPDHAVASADGPDCLSVFGLETQALEQLEGVARTTVDTPTGPCELLVFRSQGSVPGADCWLIVFPEVAGEALGALCSGKGEMRDIDALEDWEVAHGVPRIGRDFIVDSTIAMEAGLWRGMSLSKGCYLGQEVLERLFSRGNAARRLVQFTAAQPVAAGDKLEVDGADAGWITAAIQTDGGAVGMAMLRRKAIGDGITVSVADGGAVIHVGEFVGGPTPESP